MSDANRATVAVIKGNEYIMPRAVKPTTSGRPKPAPIANK